MPIDAGSTFRESTFPVHSEQASAQGTVGSMRWLYGVQAERRPANCMPIRRSTTSRLWPLRCIGVICLIWVYYIYSILYLKQLPAFLTTALKQFTCVLQLATLYLQITQGTDSKT